MLVVASCFWVLYMLKMVECFVNTCLVMACFTIFIICDEVLVKVGVIFSNFLFNIMANNTSHLLLLL
jgi:hypothetical protein